jgi:hypothetical protein
LDCVGELRPPRAGPPRQAVTDLHGVVGRGVVDDQNPDVLDLVVQDARGAVRAGTARTGSRESQRRRPPEAPLVCVPQTACTLADRSGMTHPALPEDTTSQAGTCGSASRLSSCAGPYTPARVWQTDRGSGAIIILKMFAPTSDADYNSPASRMSRWPAVFGVVPTSPRDRGSRAKCGPSLKSRSTGAATR